VVAGEQVSQSEQGGGSLVDEVLETRIESHAL
jgi:hypothetical protein